MSITVLSIYPGHNSTAALLKDGKILGVVSEERFTRIKNQGGFPRHSIRWLLKEFDLKPEEVSCVAICGSKLIMGVSNIQEGTPKGPSLLSKIYGRLEYNAGSHHMLFYRIKEFLVDRRLDKQLSNAIVNNLWKEFKIPFEKIDFVEHHTCHAYAAYHGLTQRREKALVLTLDGEGDDVCATVNIANGYEMKRIAQTWKLHSIGYIYSLTTAFMGMSPLEHEYKVMGLAPYAASKEQKYFLKTYNKVFKGQVFLDKKNPLVFNSKFPTNRFTLWLEKKAVGERFDNLAGALQHFTEETVKAWVQAAVKKTKISNVYCGGGVFMNVKMNLILSELPDVKSINILPSAGDESNPIGAAYYCYTKRCKRMGTEPQTKKINDLYLGPNYDDDVEAYVKVLKKKYSVERAHPTLIAQMLARGDIIARCAGRMEWGARSLGNRCIMANPSDLKYVWEINEQIKMRDFWMPFAPTILSERENDYVINPKHIKAPYMIMAFHSTDVGKKELRAALHQADFTLRPQVLEREWNPKYYDIIKEFEKITGIGGVLNTSFNLHGKPIVATPKDAVEEVFENSGLKHLLLGDYLVSKKD